MTLHDAIEMGLQDAASRLQTIPTSTKLFRHAIEGRDFPGVSRGVSETLLKVLDGQEVSDHFARLFSEMTAIAQASRAAYGEPLLTHEQIAVSLDAAKAFFNSFRHL